MTYFVRFLFAQLFVIITATEDSRRLYADLLGEGSGYNQLIRPVKNPRHSIPVYFGLKLHQILDVDVRNQIFTTKVWLVQKWKDLYLSWNVSEYGGVETLIIPSDQIWVPDIIMLNSGDGEYQLNRITKAFVHNSGLISWESPAIYKSSCMMNMEFFPFDSQYCSMKFVSFTYDKFSLDLKHIKNFGSSQETIEYLKAQDVDITEFERNSEWDLLNASGIIKDELYACCVESYPALYVHFIVKRKPLYYTIYLVLPCVILGLLSLLVFYLPADSGEKMSLCLSIFVSLNVFVLMLNDITPPTSIIVPLIGKYLLFTTILLTITVMVSVVISNVHYRSPTTHAFPGWVRTIFLKLLPKLLMMKRPKPIANKSKATKENSFDEYNLNDSVDDCGDTSQSRNCSTIDETNAAAVIERKSYSPEVLKAFSDIWFIADNLKQDEEISNVKEDWKYVAMVLDRLFLWVLSIAFVIGTVSMFLQAPIF